jgi:hypothetical protein
MNELSSHGAQRTAVALTISAQPPTLDELAALTGRSRRSVKRDVAELITGGDAIRVGHASRYTTPRYQWVGGTVELTWANVGHPGTTTKQGGLPTMTYPDGSPPARPPAPAREASVGQRAAGAFAEARTIALKGKRPSPRMIRKIGSLAKAIERDHPDAADADIIEAARRIGRDVTIGPGLLDVMVERVRSGEVDPTESAHDKAKRIWGDQS